MTTSQRKAIRLSEIRERLNVLLNAETRSAAEDTELTTLTNESATCEREYRAAVTVESDDAGSVIVSTGEAETRARRELRSRTGIADFLRAAAGGSRVTGAAAEYAAEVIVSSVPTSGIFRSPSSSATGRPAGLRPAQSRPDLRSMALSSPACRMSSSAVRRLRWGS